MAKLVRRFHVNTMKIRHQFIPKKAVDLAKQNHKEMAVPPMPAMRWNQDGSPCFKHLEEEQPKEIKKIKGKNGVEVYPMPRINWRKETQRCQ